MIAHSISVISHVDSLHDWCFFLEVPPFEEVQDSSNSPRREEAWNEAPEWFGEFRTVEWKNLQAEFAEATRRCDIPEVAASGQEREHSEALGGIADEMRVEANELGPRFDELLATKDSQCTVVLMPGGKTRAAPSGTRSLRHAHSCCGTALQPGSVLAMVSKPACLKCCNVLNGRPMMSKPSFRPVSTSRGAAVPTQSLLPRPPFKRARADGTFLHPEWRHSDRGALQWAQ